MKLRAAQRAPALLGLAGCRWDGLIPKEKSLRKESFFYAEGFPAKLGRMLIESEVQNRRKGLNRVKRHKVARAKAKPCLVSAPPGLLVTPT